MNGTLILISFIALVLGAVIGYFVKNYQLARETDKKQHKANRILTEAELKSTEIIKESQERAIEITQAAEKVALSRRTEITRFEERLQSRRRCVTVLTCIHWQTRRWLLPIMLIGCPVLILFMPSRPTIGLL